MPIQMDDHDGPCLWGNASINFVRVKCVSEWVDITEHWACPCRHQCGHRWYARVGSDQNFVPAANPESLKADA